MPVDPAVGPAGLTIDVRFVRVEDVLDGPPKLAQGDEQLLVVLRRAAQVRLALEHQEGRVDRRDVAERRLAPELVDALGAVRVAQQRRPVVLGPESELAQSLIWLVTPFSDTAARNRSDVPTSQLTMNPPY